VISVNYFSYLILFHFLGIGFDGCQYITNGIPTNTGLAARLSSSGIFFFLLSKIYIKGAKGRNPKYTGCIQGTPKEQGKENNCLKNQNRNNHV